MTSIRKSIDTGLMASLRARAMINHGDMILPRIRFFTGNALFFNALGELVAKHTGIVNQRRPMIIECGCGSQDTTRDLQERGFLVRGCDIFRREGQSDDVYISDATTLPFDAMTWALICRPDHSGWADATIKKALNQGGVGIYVGLQENYDNDISPELQERFWDGVKSVGLEGEDMWVFK